MFIQQFNANWNNIRFDIKFKDNITVIYGESGVGKSVLYRLMLDRYKAGKLKYNMYFFNADSSKEILKNSIFNSSVAVFVIDNAAIMLDMDTRFFVSVDKRNQYIIFDHTLKGYSLGSNSRRRLVFSNNRMFLEGVGDSIL